ncbi:MAG: hypothetical protein DWQ36_15930 [Acidobacteria bacterium]|nr:MAG: hypothetical protein DWQ30_14605 [Acidobacteriota bacterium]REK05600.1 MAG: hypothetical protein DWQ36_15930 [Acidobacteriota bacterium]
MRQSFQPPLALAGWHTASGAHLGEVPGIGGAVVRGYGDPGSETAAGVWLIDRSWCGRLELVGADRARFLGGLVTCRVVGREPGECCYGYFTDGKGRILADVLVLVLADRLWLELPPGKAAEIRQHLEKYIVADRVEVRPLGDFVQLAVGGAQLPGAWQASFGEPLPDGCRTVRLGNTELFAHAHPRLPAPAAQLWISSGIAEPVAADLLAALTARAIGFDELERRRIVAGIPRFGRDFDERSLPGEVAVEGAVDFEKGCYLGQEIVARMHYRGRAARELRRLRLEDPRGELAEHLALGRDLELSADPEEKPGSAGHLTSWAATAPAAASAGALAALASIPRPVLEDERALVVTLAGDAEDRQGAGRWPVRIVGPPDPSLGRPRSVP